MDKQLESNSNSPKRSQKESKESFKELDVETLTKQIRKAAEIPKWKDIDILLSEIKGSIIMAIIKEGDAHNKDNYEQIIQQLYVVYGFLLHLIKKFGAKNLFIHICSFLQCYTSLKQQYPEYDGLTFLHDIEGLSTLVDFLKNQKSPEKKKTEEDFNEYTCLELSLVDVLEATYNGFKDKDPQPGIIDRLIDFFNRQKNNLIYHLSKEKSLNLAIVNRLCFNAFHSLKWILSKSTLLDDYLSRLTSLEMIHIDFFIKLVTINLYQKRQDPHKTVIKIRPSLLEQTSLFPSSLKKHKSNVFNYLDDSVVTIDLEVFLVPDRSLSSEEAISGLFKELILNYNDSVLLTSSEFKDKYKKEFDLLSEGMVIMVYEIVMGDMSDSLKLKLFKSVDLISFIKNMMHSFDSIDQLNKIIFLYLQSNCNHNPDLENDILLEMLTQNCLHRVESCAALMQVYSCIISAKLSDANSNTEKTQFHFPTIPVGMILDQMYQIVKSLPSQPFLSDPRLNEVVEKVFVMIASLNKTNFEKLKIKILSIMNEIFQNEIMLQKVLFSGQLMNVFFQKFSFGPQSFLLLNFMSSFFPKLKSESDSDKKYRSNFFSKIKTFLEYLDSQMKNSSHEFTEEMAENYRHIFNFFCQIIIKLLNGEQVMNFFDLYEKDIKKEDESLFDLNNYLFTQKNQEYQTFFLTTGIYEIITNCLYNPMLQTRLNLVNIVVLTFSLTHLDSDLQKQFSDCNFHQKFFKVLFELNLSNPFQIKEILKIINFLLNLASQNDFYYLLEERVDEKKLYNPSELWQTLKDNKNNEIQVKYLSINSEDTLFVVLKLIFELSTNTDVKLSYLKIIDSVVQYSFYNALSCGQSLIVEYLLVCLRKEKNEKIKGLIASIVAEILKISVNVAQLKTLLRTCRFLYSKVYPGVFEKLLHPVSRKNFEQSMVDLESYYYSLKYVFHHIIKEVLNHSEDNQNFIHFSGEQSGILVRNLNFKPAKSFSVIIQFRCENLKTMNKRNIYIFDNMMNNNNNDLTLNDNISSRLSNNPKMLSSFKINDQYFSGNGKNTASRISHGGTMRNPTILGGMQKGNDDHQNFENYYPRIFKLISNNGICLDMYIGYHENRRKLFVEGKNPKKDSKLRDIYDAEFEENMWYTILLSYSSKSGLTIYLDEDKLTPHFKSNFTSLIDNFDSQNSLVIGSSIIPDTEMFDPQTSLQGQVKHFFILPFETTAEKISKYFDLNSDILNSKKSKNLNTASKLKKLLFKKKYSDIDRNELNESSILNLNTFVRISRLNVHNEIQWTTSYTPIPERKKTKKKSFLNPSKLFSSKKTNNSQESSMDKIEIKSSGVFFLEKSRFEDLLFSIGDIDLFLMCVPLLNKFDQLKSSNAQDLLCDVLQILKMLCLSDHRDDVMRFISNNGFYVIAYLIEQFVNQHGISYEIINSLIEFIEAADDAVVKYKGSCAFFWKFTVWSSCSYDKQIEIFKRSKRLLVPEIKKDLFKKNFNIIGMLYYTYQNLRPDAWNQDNEDGTNQRPVLTPQHRKDVAKLRKEIQREALTVILHFRDFEISRQELKFFIKYICAIEFDEHLLEVLQTLQDIVKLCVDGIKEAKDHLTIENLFAVFYEFRLAEVLAYLMIKCGHYLDVILGKEKDSELQELYNLGPKSIEYKAKDLIMSKIIEVINVIYFRMKAYQYYQNKDHKIDYELYFQKLMIKCLDHNLGPYVIEKLINMITKTEYESEITTENQNLITIVFRLIIRTPSQFLMHVLKAILQLFQKLPNIYELLKNEIFIEFLYTCQLRIFENSDKQEHESLLLQKEILSKSILASMKFKHGFFNLLRILSLGFITSNSQKIGIVNEVQADDILLSVIKSYLNGPLNQVALILDDKSNQLPSQLGFQDIKSINFILNLFHLLTYVSVWIPANIDKMELYEDTIVELIKNIYQIFKHSKIIYSTYPELRQGGSLMNDSPKEMVEKIQNHFLLPNGGILATMIGTCIQLAKCCSKQMNRISGLDLILCLIKTNDKQLQEFYKNKKNFQSLLGQKINASNLKLKEILQENRVDPYFSLGEKGGIKIPEVEIQGFILYNSIQYFFSQHYKSMKNEALEGENELPPLSKENAKIIKIIQHLLIQAGGIFITEMQQGAPVIEEDEPAQPKSSLSDIGSVLNSKKENQKDLENSLLTKLEKLIPDHMTKSMQEKDKSRFEMNYTEQDLTFLLDICKSCELTEEVQENGGKSPDQDALLIITNKQLQLIQKQIIVHKKSITKSLMPYLQDGPAKNFDVIFSVAEYYYAFNQIVHMQRLINRQQDFRISDLDAEVMKCGIIHKDYKQTFEAEFQDWEIQQLKTRHKIMKKWSFHEKRLLQDRGIWQVEDENHANIHYKIDKSEDFMRRRMRLRKDNQAANKEYLSVSAYQKKLKSISNQPTISLPIEEENVSLTLTSLKSEELDGVRKANDASVLDLQVSKTTSPLMTPSKRLHHQDADLDFNLIPKEEVLADIKEKQFDMATKQRKKNLTRWKNDCEKIALKGAVYGSIEITETNYIIFTPSKDGERPDKPPYNLGALKDSFIKTSFKKKQWNASNISEVHARNYNLMPTAVEIFVRDDGKTYFFNLYREELQKQFIQKMKAMNPTILDVTDRAKDFQKSDLKKKWVEGELSNFDYLMALNTYAGRSYNDINQYPVFPWIVKDYSSRNLDFNNIEAERASQVFRRLDTPIGAMRENKKNDAMEKYENWDESLNGEPAFHYGTHYSNAGLVINFLIRLEPFTSLNIQLQNGKFDQADRLFYSIPGAWDSCYRNRGDFRELTPEFYYQPGFLRNINNIDFGVTQTNQRVHDVELPKWASSAEEFIVKHRQALESEYVSRNLNEWIDLIFGYKQQGEEAVKAFNVFRYLSYEGKVQLDKIDDPADQYGKLVQIFHLGQTPSQLFTEKHPPKKIKKNNDKFRFYILPSQKGEDPEKGLNMSLLSSFSNHPIIYVHRGLQMVHVIFKNLEMFSIPYEPKSLLFDFFKWNDLKHKSPVLKLGKIIFNDYSPQNQIATLDYKNSETIFVIGGYIDNSFRIFKDSQLLQSVKFHSKLVTAVDAVYIPRVKQAYIVVGSKDCRLTVWKQDISSKFVNEDKKENYEILYGHHNEITCLSIEKSLGIIVSCDKDGCVLIYCLASGKLLRSIQTKFANDEYVKMVKADQNGFIVLITTKDRIFVYSNNGVLINQTDKYGPKYNNSIRSFAFIDKLKTHIIIATLRGELILVDFLSMNQLKNLSQNMKFLDRSQSDKSEKEVERMLKGATINTLTVGEESKHMYLGYENGCFSILGKNYQDCYEEFKQNLTELGIDI